MSHILLIEDDEPLRSVIAEALIRAGHEVTEAADGAKAMQLIREQSVPFDLTITDLIMPHRDGLEMIQDLRKLQPKARIIAISGTPVRQPEICLKLAHHLGAGRTLLKPFTTQTLLSTVDTVLNNPSDP